MKHLSIILLGFSAFSGADTLTLEQAKARALEYNSMLKAQESKVEAAEQQLKIAESYRLPKLEVSSNYIRTDQPASAFALKMNQKQFSMMDFQMSDPNNPDYLDTFLTSVSLSAPIYTGGQIRHGIRAAEKQKEGYRFEYDRKSQELSKQVTRVYLGVLLADEYVRLLEKARDTVLSHVEMARDYFDAGFIVESDVLRAQVEMSRVEDQLIRAENGARTARLGLNILMGSNPDTEWLLVKPAPPVRQADLNHEEQVQAALEQRPDLKYLDSMVEAMEENIRRLKGQRLPTVGLQLAHEWYDDAFLGDTGSAATMVVGMKIPLFTGGRIKAETARASAQKDEIVRMRDAMRDGVVLQVRQALFDVREAGSRMRVAEGNTEVAEKNLSIVEERYKKGIMKITDLLDADTALTEAETRLLNSVFDYQLALEELKLATGEDTRS